jgi:hypothetical protein
MQCKSSSSTSRCNSFSTALATSDITGVLALGVVGLAEEVVDPLEEVLEREALGESLAGLAVGLVARAGGCGDGSVKDRRGEGAGHGRDVGCRSSGGGWGVVGGAAGRAAGGVVGGLLLGVILRLVVGVVRGLNGSRRLSGGGGGSGGAGQGDGGGAASGRSRRGSGEGGLAGGLRGRLGGSGGLGRGGSRSLSGGVAGRVGSRGSGGRGARGVLGRRGAGGRATSGGSRAGGTARVDSRARDLVVSEAVVDAERNTRVAGSVQLSGDNTGGLGGTATSNLDVDALGVVLGTVGVLGGVKGDDLVAENVLAGSDVFGDSDGPSEVVLDEVVGGPVLRSGIVQSLLVDLEEGQVTSLDGSAVVTSALRQVVQNGTVVRLGPGVPLKLDLTTSGDSGDLGARLAGLWYLVSRLHDSRPRCEAYLVASDVRATVRLRSNEAVVAVLCAPGDDFRGARVSHGAGEALVLLAININADDTAVSVGVGGEGAQKGGFLHERHVY